MLKYISSESMGHTNQFWLDSYNHFSFACYTNPKAMQYGVLRVLNDDMVGAGTGFSSHRHENMEIISYVVDGELTHIDSLDNRSVSKRGQMQYMSAGTGIEHGEYNYGFEVLRFLQIWFLPDKAGYKPVYKNVNLDWDARIGNWLQIVGKGTDVEMHTDANIYVSLLPRKEKLEFEVENGRQAYFVIIEGEAVVNGVSLFERDAMMVENEKLEITAEATSHMMIIEMAKLSEPITT